MGSNKRVRVSVRASAADAERHTGAMGERRAACLLELPGRGALKSAEWERNQQDDRSNAAVCY